MIVSGWLEALSTNDNLVYGDYIAETQNPDGSGADVLASIALSLYQQGTGGDVDGDAVAYIRAYGTTSNPYVDVPPDAAHNAYYVYGSTFVMFRLAVEFAYAYAHAMTLPLDDTSGRMAKVVHRNFLVRTSDGGRFSQVRFGLRAENSRLDIDLALRRAVQHAAEHHGIVAADLKTHEIAAEERAYSRPRRRKLP